MKIYDLSGMVFSRLKVLEKAEDYISPTDGRRVSQWLCECECGKIKIVRGSDLRSGRTQSCGCLNSETTIKNNKSRFIDITGEKFGKLKVLKLDYIDNHYGAMWECQCECGLKVSVKGVMLRNGITKSCGCATESKIATEIKVFLFNNYGAKIEHKEFRNPKTGNLLRFDVYIPFCNTYIELHGGQHYKKEKIFGDSYEDSQNRIYRDEIKKQYALENGCYLEVKLDDFECSEDAIKYILGEIFLSNSNTLHAKIT